MTTSVLVIGTGTIGEPLIGLLCDHKQDFGIDEVIFHKRTPLRTDRSKVRDLIERRGARLAVDEDRRDDFAELNMKAHYSSPDALEKAAVVIDCKFAAPAPLSPATAAPEWLHSVVSQVSCAV